MAPQGTKQEKDALEGRGLLQSAEEWEARDRILSDTLCALVNRYATVRTHRALDVGCETGKLTDLYSNKTTLHWWGLDPDIDGRQSSPQGTELLSGYAHEIPFPDAHFDCLMFANVYEHVDPEMREPALEEMIVTGEVHVLKGKWIKR